MTQLSKRIQNGFQKNFKQEYNILKDLRRECSRKGFKHGVKSRPQKGFKKGFTNRFDADSKSVQNLIEEGFNIEFKINSNMNQK